MQPEDLIEHFGDQIDALRASCEGYDRGDRWEAKRIATALHILCHDPPLDRKSKSKSLLSRMGIKHQLSFISSIRPDAKTYVPTVLLAIVKFDNEEGPYFAPMLESGWEHHLQFLKWYNETVFYGKGVEISRKNLILTMRNQDGGAHVDGQISLEDYVRFRYENDTRILRSKKMIPGTGKYEIILDIDSGFPPEVDFEDYQTVPFAHLATIRHIGFEFLKSLDLHVQS